MNGHFNDSSIHFSDTYKGKVFVCGEIYNRDNFVNVAAYDCSNGTCYEFFLQDVGEKTWGAGCVVGTYYCYSFDSNGQFHIYVDGNGLGPREVYYGYKIPEYVPSDALVTVPTILMVMVALIVSLLV